MSISNTAQSSHLTKIHWQCPWPGAQSYAFNNCTGLVCSGFVWWVCCDYMLFVVRCHVPLQGTQRDPWAGPLVGRWRDVLPASSVSLLVGAVNFVCVGVSLFLFLSLIHLLQSCGHAVSKRHPSVGATTPAHARPSRHWNRMNK